MILKMLEKYEHDLKNGKRKQYWYRSMYKKCSQCNIYKHHTWIELVSTCLCHKLFKALSNTYIPEHPFKDCRQSYVSEPWYSGWEFFLKEDNFYAVTHSQDIYFCNIVKVRYCEKVTTISHFFWSYLRLGHLNSLLII